MIKTIFANEENDLLQTTVDAFFIGWDLNVSRIFRPEVRNFLFFNYESFTEPDLFHSFLERSRSSAYIGYLPLFIQRTEERVPSGLYVTEDATLEEITEAFTQDPGLPDDAAIQYFVRSGFVLPRQGHWAIWFSTYWEIAICGFVSDRDAQDFRSGHSDLMFLSNEDVLSRYSTNPTSTAPSLLSYHLQLNALERPA